MPSATTRRDPPLPSGVPRRLRREPHRPAPGSDRRQHRRDLRRHRRAVRRLLSAPPPDYEVDDAGPHLAADDGASHGRTGKSRQSGRAGRVRQSCRPGRLGHPGRPGQPGKPGQRSTTTTRRTRIRLALASIPLAVALVLLALTLAGGGGGSGTTGEVGAVDTVDEMGAVGAHGEPGAGAGPASDTHGGTGTAGGPVAPTLAAVQEPVGQDPLERTGDGGRRTVTEDDDSRPEEPGEPPESVPDPPPGHRSVAVRLASPDAGDLVRGGDRVDVVGPDARVLAASLAVLQVRSAAGATVLVVAVPEDDAPRLAAAAAGPGLTAVVAPDQDPVPDGS